MARPKKKKQPKTLFGKRLLILFGDSNYSSFEAKYGLSIGQISKFIDGVEPRLSAVEAIVKGAGCNPVWLLLGEGEPFYNKGQELKMGDNITNAMFKYFLETEGAEKATVLVKSNNGTTKDEKLSALALANDQFIAFDYGDDAAFAVYPLSSVIRIRVRPESE